MILQKLVVGPLEVNCYIFGDEGSGAAAVIDPGGDPATIRDFIKKNRLVFKYVINTHGHGDHIGGNAQLGREAEGGVLIHKLDADLLADPGLNLSRAFGLGIRSPRASRLLNDGDKIGIGKETLEVIHTPGHTQGSVCLKTNNLIFSGDTLFFEGVGRTDLPGSSWAMLMDSIKNKLMLLPDECRVYPGHGPETTIGHERRHNPFI